MPHYSSQMKTGVTVSILNKINFSANHITKDEKVHFIVIKRSVHLRGKKNTKSLYT